MTDSNTHATRMNKGKRIIMGGLVMAMAGLVSYCIVGLGMGARFALTESNVLPGGPVSIGMIAIGTLLCFIGNVIYLKAAIDKSFDDYKGT